MNVIILITAAALALSPFITQWTTLNQMLGLENGIEIKGNYPWVLLGMGGMVLLLSSLKLYTGRSGGMMVIIAGVICLAVGYFHNDEKFAYVPVTHVLLGGGEFIAFVASVLLVLLGLLQEFLVGVDRA